MAPSWDCTSTHLGRSARRSSLDGASGWSVGRRRWHASRARAWYPSRAARWAAWQHRRRRSRQRQQWEDKWGRAEFDRPWLGRAVSPEIRAAVTSGWFIPGGRALDTGCGAGDVAAWLAAQGFSAIGI